MADASRNRKLNGGLVRTLFIAAIIVLGATHVFLGGSFRPNFSGHGLSDPADAVLISYSYFEKDNVQKTNFDFFITIAMGLDNKVDQPRGMDFVIVQSGETCSPCTRLTPLLEPVKSPISGLRSASASQNGRVRLLVRSENEGMDFAAHNATVTYVKALGQLARYKYVLLLNSSIRGPFYPSYMPAGWQWPRAFTDRLRGDVHVVSSSLVCLPEMDAGGYGPKLESWAAAVDQKGLQVLVEEGVFELRTCKLCADGVVVKGEYGLTEAMKKHGYTIDTLMSKYRNVDWRDKKNWNCNNNVHPSRHGTYDGLSMHPYEVVFVKASWHVGHPFIDKYMDWALTQASGESSTAGQFDEEMYRYGVSMPAQDDHHVEQCYKVLDRDKA